MQCLFWCGVSNTGNSSRCDEDKNDESTLWARWKGTTIPVYTELPCADGESSMNVKSAQGLIQGEEEHVHATPIDSVQGRIIEHRTTHHVHAKLQCND